MDGGESEGVRWALVADIRRSDAGSGRHSDDGRIPPGVAFGADRHLLYAPAGTSRFRSHGDRDSRGCEANDRSRILTSNRCIQIGEQPEKNATVTLRLRQDLINVDTAPRGGRSNIRAACSNRGSTRVVIMCPFRDRTCLGLGRRAL